MTPWPDAQTSDLMQHSPGNQMPQSQFQQHAQQHQPPKQHQQELTHHPQQQLDPWAAMLTPPPAQHAPLPSQLQTQQHQVDPWAAMLTPPPAQHAPVPLQSQAPPAPPASKQLTPPPTMVVYDASSQNPPSPMGDLSVLAAAFGNHDAATVQPLRPQPAAIAPENPFDFGAVASSMPAVMPPPPMGLPPPAPPTPPRDASHQLQQQQQLVAHTDPFGYACVSPTPQQTVSPPMSPVPKAAFVVLPPQQQIANDPFGYATSPNPQQHQQQAAYPAYGFSPQQINQDPFGYAFSPMTSPVVSPGNSQGNNLIANSPFDSPPFTPSDSQAIVQSHAINEDPFDVFNGRCGQTSSALVPAPASNDPFGVGVKNSTALVSASASDDPFGMGVLGGSSSALVATTSASGEDYGDLLGGMFGAPAQADSTTMVSAGNGFASSSPLASRPPIDPRLEHLPEELPIKLDSNGLPSEGEYYEARINARSLGTMFYTARNLEETLFLRVPNNVIEALGQRPVVSYVAENSAAHNAGVLLGHVVLSVNGQDISNPENCADMIRNLPRPIVLRCYAPPDLELTVTEGLHKVKYDTKDMDAPQSSVEWKEKYVVVGGIVTKPWMMNMFYKKGDYDIAVKEAHAGHKISVKVKQFDLRGARIILKGNDGMPNRIVYPSEGKPWFYITILPNKGYPIKISSESMNDLEPIYAGIRRFVKKDMEARYSSQLRHDAQISDETQFTETDVTDTR
ncbi:hypothetical protein ACHAXA_009168 [Cyclostephanos tholiformis]|uniref:PDZ domain-containing protein n=1 Tax=Cyclostephanos tholiformis TaxID=382380 RepID=A0ABD3RRD1_9STRA